MLGRVNFRHRNPGVRRRLRRVEQSETHARREQPAEGHIDLAFFDEALAHGLDERHVLIAASGIRSGANSGGGAVLIVWRELVSCGDVSDSATIRGYVALKSPGVAQRRLQQ